MIGYPGRSTVDLRRFECRGYHLLDTFWEFRDFRANFSVTG